jgi:hypothetical protein
MGAPTQQPIKPEPVMVNEPALTRNRGCADLLLILIVIVVIGIILAS